MPGAARGHLCFVIERRIIGAPRQEYHVQIVRAILVMAVAEKAVGLIKRPA